MFISNNRIRSWDEVGKVAQLPEIKNVNFIGNPIYGPADRDRSENWPMVTKKIPQLESIDGKMISASVRQAADALDWTRLIFIINSLKFSSDTFELLFKFTFFHKIN